MVIEYAGNVIRSIQTDKREKYYDSKVSRPRPPGAAASCGCEQVPGSQNGPCISLVQRCVSGLGVGPGDIQNPA